MSLLRIATVTALAGQRLRLGLTDGTTIEREVGPIVKLASARSRRSALLRPRCARLAALTATSANLMRQLSTAQANSARIDAHGDS